MKMSIQTKLLLPSLLTLVLLMIGGSLLVSHKITQQLEENGLEAVETSTSILLKGVSNAAVAYKNNVTAMASSTQLRPLADYLSGLGDASSREEAVQSARALLAEFTSLYHSFPVVNITDGEGHVVAGSGRKKNENASINVGGLQFFKDAMRGETTISEPVMSEEAHAKVVVVATPLKNSQGASAGVLYAMLPCANIARNTIADVSIGEHGYGFIVDGRGRVVAHPDPRFIQEFDIATTDWGRQMLSGTSGTLHFINSAGVNNIVSFKKDADSGWIIASCIDEDELQEESVRIRNISLGIMLASAAVVGLLIFLVIRPVIGDLGRIVSFAQAVDRGNMEETLGVRRSDEMGELCNALRNMVVSLKEMIATSRKDSEMAKEESARAQEAMTRAREAHKAAEGARREGILQAAGKLEDVGNIVSSASTELAAQIEESDQSAAESAKRLSEAATAMNEMNTAVQEVARNASAAAHASAETRQKAGAGEHVVRKSVESIEEVRTVSLALKQDMEQLNARAQDITRIMNVISDIADQTNLLALNAAIEAARAGDAGRGFAVVADEVRKLAEKTMESTNDVSNATRAIQESTAKSMESVEQSVERIAEATKYAQESGAALVEIVATAEITTDQVNAIATASEEQSASSEEINRSITEVNDMSRQTAQAMDQAAKAVSDLSMQAQSLNALIQEMKHS